MMPDRVRRHHRRPGRSDAAAGPNQNQNQNQNRTRKQTRRPRRPECDGPILHSDRQRMKQLVQHRSVLLAAAAVMVPRLRRAPQARQQQPPPHSYMLPTLFKPTIHTYARWITRPAGNHIQSPSLAAARPGLPWHNQNLMDFITGKSPPSPLWQPRRDASDPVSSSSLLQRRRGG